MVLSPIELVNNVVAAIGTGGTSAAARLAALASAEALIRETLAAEGRHLSDAEIRELAATIVGASADGAFDWAALDPTGWVSAM